ncbi:DUF2520 domain-containing protein [Micromonospora sp. DT81.3]|uniref:DUF2520 domain-containing protein n=1 Tax=Micromonospora sp. DT81.3 TaxID=3416523 RepID=UPI003CF118D5
MNRDGRLGVGIIGAGKVGPVLGAALGGAGHAITGITSGSDDDRASAVLPGVPVLDALEVVRRSELVVLAVPHDELGPLVAGLAVVGAWQLGQLVMHTDAAYGIEVLRPAAERGAIPLAVHPAISFTGTSIDLRQLAAGYAAVTAPAAVLPIAQALAVELGCEPIVIAEEDRPAYAEAIGIATAFSRTIVQQATGLLRDIGVENPGGYLSALVRSTVDQALVDAPPRPGDVPPLGNATIDQ